MNKKLNKDQQRRVVENLKFAKDLALNFGKCGVDVMELQSASMEGLCEAAMRYDESKGAEFQTYAYNYCRKYILIAIKDCTMPMNVPMKWRKDITMLHLDLSFEAIGSADADEGTDADRLLYAVAEPAQDEVMIADERCEWLNTTKRAHLTATERQVIDDVYGFGGKAMSRKEVARLRKISPERVRQVEKHAINKMRMVA